MNSQLWWFVARASGLVAWLMLTASVLWGVVLSTKAFPGRRRPAWLLDLHRWLGGLTISFVAIHLASLVADSYTHFGWAALAIPYASTWKPGAVALGVIAAWALVAIELTSLARRRLPRRAWRAIHLASYLTFWSTSLHAAYAGTDRSRPLYQWTTAIAVIAVAWALMYRISNRRSARAEDRGAATGRSSVPRPQGEGVAGRQVDEVVG